MEHKNNFALLRKLLGAIGLSPEAVDDIIERINDFLFDKGQRSTLHKTGTPRGVQSTGHFCFAI